MNRRAYQQNFFMSLAVMVIGLLILAFVSTLPEGRASSIWSDNRLTSKDRELTTVSSTLAATNEKFTAKQSVKSSPVESIPTDDSARFAITHPVTGEETISPLPRGEQAIVTRVIDGDTIVISTGQIVRYIGIDTPETSGESPECFSLEATRRNESLVLGKTVTLTRDVSETDRYGRLLRFVFVGDELINATLLREGYARVATFPPDVARAQEFVALEAAARAAGRGVWGGCSSDATRSDSDPSIPQTHRTSCPVDAPIKGNAQSKIYHLPGQHYYDATRPEVCFATETEARAAGYRKAKL